MTAEKVIVQGTRFGTLVVVNAAHTTTHTSRPRKVYTCVCDCGAQLIANSYKLRKGLVATCAGCRGGVRRTHGMSKTPTYSSWASMRKRCSCPNDKNFVKYSGLGYDKRWDDFSVFLAEVGVRPSMRHTLDRIDNSKGYFLGNVRWASWKAQQRNRTNNRTLLLNGRPVTLAEAAEHLGLSRATVQQRLSKRKLPLAEALGGGFTWPTGVNPYTGAADGG